MIWASVAAFTFLNHFFSVSIFIQLKFMVPVTSEAQTDECVMA